MKIKYISGSITASPKQQEENMRRFFEKAAELRSLGIKVHNPTEDEPKGMPIEWCYADDFIWIVKNKPDFYFMKGWEASLGARIEHQLALQLNCKIIYEC